jgi:hypothetical protein
VSVQLVPRQCQYLLLPHGCSLRHGRSIWFTNPLSFAASVWLPASLCCGIDRSQEHVSIFGPQQFVGSTVLPDVSALFGAADAARPKDLSSFVAQCLEEPGSLAMNTNAGANPGAEQQLTKLQARFRGESTIAYRHREADRQTLAALPVCALRADTRFVCI